MAVLHDKTLTMADFTGTITGFNSQGSTVTIAATDLVRPSDWNSNHEQLYTLSGNTNNASTASGTNVVLQGVGGVTLIGSTGTIGISAIPPVTFTQTAFMGQVMGATRNNSSFGQNSLYVWPVVLPNYVSGGAVRFPVTVTHSSSAAASVQKGYTIRFGIYTTHSTNATVLTQMYSTSYTIAASHSSNASWMNSYISDIQNSTSYGTQSSSSAGLNISSQIHGAREIVMPLSTLLSPGHYWFALLNSTSSVGAGGNLLSMQNSFMEGASANRMGIAANNQSAGFYKNIGQGTYSVTTGALPSAISYTSDIRAGNTSPVAFWGTHTQ
jgi:hypothetical protein